MLSWKKSCVALALAGVVSSSVLHGQLLAAGKKRVLGDYQSQPSMDRIRNKLLDRYGTMIPESPDPSEGSGSLQRAVERGPVTVDAVVATPAKPTTPVAPAPQANPNVIPQSILPTNTVTAKPQSVMPTTVQPAVVVQQPTRDQHKITQAVPLTPLPAPVVSQKPATLPKTHTSQPTSTAPSMNSEPAYRQPVATPQSWVSTQPAAPTPVGTPAKAPERLPKLPEMAVESKPAVAPGNEPYYPGLQNRTPLVVQSAPIPVQPKASASAETKTWKKTESEEATVTPKVLPKIESAEDVATSEPAKMPHHRPASPPSAGQLPYRTRMVENVASPVAKPTPVAEPATLTKADRPENKPVTPSKERSVPAPVETANIEVVETKPVVAPPKREPVEASVKTSEPTVAASEPTANHDSETTDGKRRIIFVPPAPKVETAKPIVPLQSRQAIATKRTRSLMKPGETRFAPSPGSAVALTPEKSKAPGSEAPAYTVAEKVETKGKESNPAATPKSVVSTDKPTVTAKEKNPPAPPKSKTVATEETYAARIAATYENVVSEGKQPMQPLVDAPEPRRSALPGSSPVPVAKKVDKPSEKAIMTASKEFPPAKGETPVKPSTPTPAVKPATPSMEIAKKEPEGSPAGLSFVIERARQGSLLINETVPPAAPPAVASSTTKLPQKSEVFVAAAPTKEATSLPAPAAVVTASVKDPGSRDDSVSKPAPVVQTEALAKAEPVKVELPKIEGPAKAASAAAPEVMTITAAKPVWSEPKPIPQPTTELPAVAPVKVTNPYSKEVPATPETVRQTVKVEKLPTVKPATIASTPKEAAKAPVTPIAATKASTPIKPAASAEPTKVSLSRLEATSKEVVTGPTAAVAMTTTKPTMIPTEAVKQPTPKPQKGEVDIAAVHRNLETLRKSGVDQERLKSLEAISQIPGWEDVKTVGPVLRNIAMTDYNTHLRLSAVQMLGKMQTDRRMVVEALHISAEYDSDVTIRSTAMKLLDQIAALPAETHRR